MQFLNDLVLNRLLGSTAKEELTAQEYTDFTMPFKYAYVFLTYVSDRMYKNSRLNIGSPMRQNTGIYEYIPLDGDAYWKWEGLTDPMRLYVESDTSAAASDTQFFTMVTSKCKDMAAARLLGFIFSPMGEGQMLLNYGPEGEYFEWNDDHTKKV